MARALVDRDAPTGTTYARAMALRKDEFSPTTVRKMTRGSTYGKPPTMAEYGLSFDHPPKRSKSEPDLLVSVVTPVLNGQDHLEETIQSVLEQDYESIEYIVIDGGSTDGTLNIIERNSGVVTTWISEPDAGIFDAMNKGIARAHGELIKVLNAGDLLTPSSVSTAASLFNRSDRGVVIASEIDLIDEKGRFLKRIDRKANIEPVGPILHPSWYVDRCLYERLGLYRTSYRVSADCEMYLRFGFHGVPFIYSEIPLVKFRTGGISTRTLLGVHERYEIVRRYFSRRAALRSLIVHALTKLRSRLVISLLGETRAYRLRRWVIDARKARHQIR